MCRVAHVLHLFLLRGGGSDGVLAGQDKDAESASLVPGPGVSMGRIVIWAVILRRSSRGNDRWADFLLWPDMGFGSLA